MGVMKNVIDETVAALEAIPNLTLSPAGLYALNTPNTITERVFSVTMQTENSFKFRDRQPSGHMRYEHTLTVALLCRVFPNNQVESYKNAIDVEEEIIQRMLIQSLFPSYRVLYERSRRTFPSSSEGNSGEYVLIDIDFSIEQSTTLL